MKKRGKKNTLWIKILVSILLGFLPSLIFVSLIIQYDSPFLSYIKFLSNFSSSFWAWISAIFISCFVFFLIEILTPKNSIKKILKNKILVIIILSCFIIAFTLILIQLYLYANFTLRNDILVELSSDKENIIFTNNVEDKITFTIDLIMNPFCFAQCNYKFVDLSHGKNIEIGSFNGTVFSKKKSYDIINQKLIEGSQELNQFEISCKSEKTFFCYTSEKESKRKVLITINYELNEEDSKFKEISRKEILNTEKNLYFLNGTLSESYENINLINNSFSIEEKLIKLNELQKNYQNLNIFLEDTKELWKNQSFNLLKEKLPELINQTENLNFTSKKLNEDIIENISVYNSLIDNLNESEQMLEETSKIQLTNSLCNDLNEIILEYNNSIFNFKENISLSNKTYISKSIYDKINILYSNSKEINEGQICNLNQNINYEIFQKINFSSVSLSIINFSLEPLDPICCFNDKCEKCLTDEYSDQNYPIIFLHGQSINKELPVGYSFDSFSEIKDKLVLENYIDVGPLVLSPLIQKGIWGKVNYSIIMTGSYFFYINKTEQGETITYSNKNDIDTYATRLKNIIEFVKDKTNKNKVILVAQSMGGVVSRRYIQLFGKENVDKIILVTVPNHGISDKVKDYCSIIGPKASCEDLINGGKFMNELNNKPTEKVPTYNIIGIGCNMGDESGDGVIKNSSQYLDTVENYYFKGYCNEINFEFFHEYITFPDLYPEVYNKIYEILQNKTN